MRGPIPASISPDLFTPDCRSLTASFLHPAQKRLPLSWTRQSGQKIRSHRVQGDSWSTTSGWLLQARVEEALGFAAGGGAATATGAAARFGSGSQPEQN